MNMRTSQALGACIGTPTTHRHQRVEEQKHAHEQALAVPDRGQASTLSKNAEGGHRGFHSGDGLRHPRRLGDKGWQRLLVVHLRHGTVWFLREGRAEGGGGTFPPPWRMISRHTTYSQVEERKDDHQRAHKEPQEKFIHSPPETSGALLHGCFRLPEQPMPHTQATPSNEEKVQPAT